MHGVHFGEGQQIVEHRDERQVVAPDERNATSCSTLNFCVVRVCGVQEMSPGFRDNDG